MINWVKRKAAMLSLAMANVERNSLSQIGDTIESNVNQERRHTQGTLLDGMINGELTEEVQDFRWRMYKIMKASEDIRATITEYIKDEDGNEVPVTVLSKVDKKRALNKIKVDDFDDYILEMVVDNSESNIGRDETMTNDFINLHDKPIESVDEDGDIVITHGEISPDAHFATSKTDKPILVGRTFIPKFEIEEFAKKMHVRKINETDKLLEFYVSKYPDDENRNSKLFINEIKKGINNHLLTPFLEIKEVSFITHKTLGVYDFLEYKFDIIKFDKIIEFNGYYVIKYIAKTIIDGKYIMEEYRRTELDEKYANKEKKTK
jgi:hypothetical protein